MKKIIFAFLIISALAVSQTPMLNRVTDICVGTCSGVSNIGSYKGLIYFSAITPTNSVGLWKTDGTTTGTTLIKEVSPSFSSAYNYITEGPVTSNSLFFFGASTAGLNGYSLWRSDGTTSGTFLLTGPTNPTNIIELNGFVVFIASNVLTGNELWRSDGTQAGTFMVKDINPGANSSASYLSYEGVLNNKLFFSANNGINGDEPWVSDGTSAGTFMIKDLKTGNGGSYFNNPIAYHNEIYFTGSSTNNSGIFKTNGLLNDPVFINTNDWSDPPTILNDSLYFKAYSSLGGELYKCGGNLSITTLVKDINPGSNSSNPSFITAINGKLYFKATNGINGIEPWISDGTPSGTYMIKDIKIGSADGCYTSSFRPSNNKVYFIGEDAAFGREMWETDGTSTGTFGYDIKAGGIGTNPFNFRDYNNELYFTANDGITGNELWKIGGGITGIQELEERTNRIELYPNPNSGIFIIDAEKETMITLTNILGETILTKKLTQGKNDINLNLYSNGLYFIKTGTSTFKIIKN